jgi:PAS domain S-box-containing protein
MGEQTFGVISAQSTLQEGRFDETDLNLLNTIAANVGTAIRNAQLFDEIKRQKQYYEAVIQNSPAAIVLMDMEATVTGWNPAAERLFGYREAEALGHDIDDLVAKQPELYPEAVEYTQKTFREKQVSFLAKRTRKDGSLIEVDVSGLPVSVDGNYVGFIAIYHDVTELQRARQEAEQANQAKSTFLANMSHELRTPLNAIIGFTRIVRRKGEDLLPEKQVENLDKVLVSADHLLNLINTVLDISKIEAGRMEVKPAEFDLLPLIHQISDTIQPLVRGGVDLVVNVASDLPSLSTDQDKLKQILINLLSNAAKFTSHGEIDLIARWEDEWLRIRVQDTGIGISKEALDRVFEEFQQADSGTTRQYGGTGLGLSISRSLARLLGGDLTAASKEGEGSTFTLTIPLRYGQASGYDVKQEGSDEFPQLDGRPVVLVIDDDPNVHELLKEDLGDAGYQVVAAATGDEGLRLARQVDPFAVTLDIMMPEKDGWQVLHEIKADPVTRDIPVILLTIVDKQSLGYQLGAADYLVKPLEEEAVVSALRRLRALSHTSTPEHVLVVDDDPNIPELVSQLLEGGDYEVEAANDGQQALDMIRRQPPDVMLLDLVMPGMDGFSLLEVLRQEDYEFPVIVLTAKTLTQADHDSLKGRVEKVIQKNGLDQERLLTELRKTMDGLGAKKRGAQG